MLDAAGRSDPLVAALDDLFHFGTGIALCALDHLDLCFLVEQSARHEYRKTVDVADAFTVDPHFLYRYSHMTLSFVLFWKGRPLTA